MLDLGKNNVVLRLWTVSEAPLDVQQALPGVDPGNWVAQVPPELMDDPLVALLIVNASATQPLERVLLPDGGALLSGPLQPAPYGSGAYAGDSPYPASPQQPGAGQRDRTAVGEYDQHSSRT